jgi:23S rRNA (cytosine1962-C5)-methyltransferase
MHTVTATISSKAVDRLQAGHLWIYRSDVISCDSAPGAIVSLVDEKKRFWGKAFFSSSSLISLRLLSSEDRPIDRGFWIGRLEQAMRLRQQVVSGTEVYRLVNGEGDGMPSIIVDRYGDLLCLQTLSQGAEALKPLLVEALVELFHPGCILERNDTRVRALEGLALRSGSLFGTAPDEIICQENGLRFCFQPESGQKTGAFLDQRENRLEAQRVARGRALDCFSYNGAFAIYVARSCESVEAIDVSEAAIQQAQRNAALNAVHNIQFETENAFDRLRLLDNLRQRFDTIILDPPTFAKNRGHLASALRGYKEINLRALRLLNPGGILITATCSQHVDEVTFLNILAEAAADAGRKVQILQKRTQAQDHPFLLSMPETLYLKCIFLRVID